MKSLCPTCGQQIAPLELLLSLETNMATRLGHTAKLSPQQAEILHVLLTRQPRMVSAPDICAAIYGSTDGPYDEAQVVRSQMANLRRNLAPLSVRIETVYGTGYRLVLDELPCAAVAA
jgi:DNA-binding response OmpR family regulator